LAQLIRSSFFKPMHLKSVPANALRSLLFARKNSSATTDEITQQALGNISAFPAES
jgi:hypothetical protein